MFFSVLYQEGTITDEQRGELESRLDRLATENFEDAAGDSLFHWRQIPRGRGFTAAVPSTSSLALAAVPDGTEQATREKFMTGICDAWMDVTGCSINEIVATAADAGVLAQANV